MFLPSFQDTNHDGLISQDEFVSWRSSQRASKYLRSHHNPATVCRIVSSMVHSLLWPSCRMSHSSLHLMDFAWKRQCIPLQYLNVVSSAFPCVFLAFLPWQCPRLCLGKSSCGTRQRLHGRYDSPLQLNLPGGLKLLPSLSGWAEQQIEFSAHTGLPYWPLALRWYQRQWCSRNRGHAAAASVGSEGEPSAWNLFSTYRCNVCLQEEWMRCLRWFESTIEPFWSLHGLGNFRIPDSLLLSRHGGCLRNLSTGWTWWTIA